jgi:hypothetical protein
MSLNITEYPQRNVNDNTQFVSKWSAAHHEMTFKMQRKDFTVTFTLDPVNPLLMRLFSKLAPGQINVVNLGEMIYLESNNGDSGVFEVVSVGIAGVFYVTAVAGFNPVGAGFFNSLDRLNYFVRTNIYVVDEFNNYVLAGQSVNRPSSSGAVEVDVSSFLKSKVGYTNEFDYSLLNDKDLTLGGGYNIEYSENWKDFEGPFSGLSETELRFYVNSAKQIQDLYGQNMGEYVPFYFTSPSAAYPESKFLSDFETPTYFPGFPFSLAFIYSEYLVGIETFKGEEGFDVNGNTSIAVDLKELSNVRSQNVNRLTVNGSYPLTTKTIDVWLETDGTVDCVEFLTPGYVAVGYVESICGLPIIGGPVLAGPVDA